MDENEGYFWPQESVDHFFVTFYSPLILKEIHILDDRLCWWGLPGVDSLWSCDDLKLFSCLESCSSSVHLTLSFLSLPGFNA